ncbi:MAG: iron chelate uptake ABC transporter family permease subunit, partial [Bacillota bacterium]
MRQANLILVMLAMLACASILFACATGSVATSFPDLLPALGEVLRGRPSSLAATLLELRLGRALSAFVTGAALSLAGVMMQALLRNPLADPYVLGVSGGASVGALGAILLFSATWAIDAAAFAGAIAVALLLFLLARRDLRGGAEGDAPMLLLTGVIVSAGCGALVTLMLSIAPENRLRGMV